MIINFSAVEGAGAPYVASVSGDKITVDGVVFDFSRLKEWQSLPHSAIDCLHFSAPVSRNGDGEIELTLRFLYQGEVSDNVTFPEPVTVTRGKVKFPQNELATEAEEYVEPEYPAPHVVERPEVETTDHD